MGATGRSLLSVLLLFACLVPHWASAASPEEGLASGLKAFQRGAFDEAAARWMEAADEAQRQNKPAERMVALRYLAQAYAALGQYRRAVGALEDVVALSRASGQGAQLASSLAALGDANIALGQPEAAQGQLKQALDLARRNGDGTLAAVALNSLGNVYAMQEQYAPAIAAYRDGIAAAKDPAQQVLRARLMSNAARALRQAGQPAESKTMLDAARAELRTASPGLDTAYGLINIGVAYRELRPALTAEDAALSLQAGAALNDAATMAETIGDRRAASYAWGHLGTLYLDEQRDDEALTLTRRAVRAAQEVNAPESLYRWQWQTGRIFKAKGATDDAIESYRRAVLTLQGIRPELAAGSYGQTTSFRESVGPVYFELVDLLLARESANASRDPRSAYLVEARETMELVKVAELRDFFRDDCVDAALAKSTKLDTVSQSAVVVYPIVLTNRVELLVSSPAGLKRFSSPTDAQTLTAEVRRFRQKLEKRTTREFLPHAQRLYDWLIRPIEADLTAAKIDTLVFVPDGPLRTVPMAALHDGKQFLVEKYALGITPGLSLTDPRPLKRDHAKVLAVGLTEPVQGYPPLPNVSGELTTLSQLFGSTVLINRDFQVAELRKQLEDRDYTILHIASHGEFGGDVQKTFVLAFDSRVTMDALDRLVGVLKFRNDPLELITLSACDTAAGDDRAALGLAGVAIKAGARSALATLWPINDEASAQLIADFYRALQDPSVSRAAALRRAQLRLINDPRYAHPGFWSPFLLINNWL